MPTDRPYRTCPVCWRLVAPTRGDSPVVVRHQDKAGRHCEMSGHPFELTDPYRSNAAEFVA